MMKTEEQHSQQKKENEWRKEEKEGAEGGVGWDWAERDPLSLL